jgi:hypothetical protein
MMQHKVLAMQLLGADHNQLHFRIITCSGASLHLPRAELKETGRMQKWAEGREVTSTLYVQGGV